MAQGLAAFAGVERRFQRLGEARGVVVVDDYAHHPTEDRRDARRGARRVSRRAESSPRFSRISISRTRDFAREFGASLAAADAVFLTEIYPAREQPIEGVTSTLVADALAAAGGTLAWRGERSALADALRGRGARRRRRADDRRRRHHEDRPGAARATRADDGVSDDGEPRTGGSRDAAESGERQSASHAARSTRAARNSRRCSSLGVAAVGAAAHAAHGVLSRASRRDRRRALCCAQ